MFIAASPTLRFLADMNHSHTFAFCLAANQTPCRKSDVLPWAMILCSCRNVHFPTSPLHAKDIVVAKGGKRHVDISQVMLTWHDLAHGHSAQRGEPPASVPTFFDSIGSIRQTSSCPFCERHCIEGALDRYSAPRGNRTPCPAQD